MSGDTVTSWAVCWRIERRDGVTIGLTAHDRDLTIDGLVHRAAPGLLPSAIMRGEGDDADTMEASGPLTASAIGTRDLGAGRWDGAEVTVFMVDWSRTPPPTAPLARGSFGAVSTTDGGFTAQLRGPAALLDMAVTEMTSPDCRAELGDARCRVPMAGRRHPARIVASDADTVTIDLAEPVANAFAGGRIKWLTGANSGLESGVAGSAGSTLHLREPPPLPVRAGDRIEASEGCDKLLATCRGHFANVANFRGEPFLPGIDLLTRYPGA